MRTFKAVLQHRLNMLHVYCLLCRMGLSPRRARALAVAWGHMPFYRLLYGA